jgi:DNA-binding response OmpR family regulator
MPAETILVIDDDSDQLRKLSLRLSRLGYRIVDASDAAIALQKADRVQVDAVVCKGVLPIISAFDLCVTFRTAKRFADTPIILFTNDPVERTAETEAQRAGATRLVVQEADFSGIIEALRSTLNASKSDASDVDPFVLASVRGDFLTDAEQRIQQYIAEFESGMDVEALKQWTHRAGGSGGMLGFELIGHAAAEIEALLNDPTARDRLGILARLQSLRELILSERRAEPESARVAPAVRKAIGGKRFGLLGFTEAESGRITQLLEAVEAFVRILEPSDIEVASTLGNLDVLAASLGGFPETQSGSPCDALLLTHKPLLIVGDAEAIGESVWGSEGAPRDFVLRPWDADELYFRCYHLLSGMTQVTRVSKPHDAAGTKWRVLVVDDDPTIVSLMRVTLESYKIECYTADRGGLAYDMALRIQPHAIVLDVNMPELDGFAVLTQLKQNDRTRAIPVVMLTAMRQEKDIIRGFALGADDYVVKPFNPMELAARLRRLLKASGAHGLAQAPLV